MTTTNRLSVILIGASTCVALASTGCNLPISRLAPKLPTLDHFSTGSHGVACCANGDCTSSRLAPVSRPLSSLNSEHPVDQSSGTIRPATDEESQSIYSLFTADRAANQKHGLFSCGEHARRSLQIRSQNQAAAPELFPQGDSSGIARVTPRPTNQIQQRSSSPYSNVAQPSGQLMRPIQQTGAIHFSSAEPRLAVSETGQPIDDGHDDFHLTGKPHEQYPDEYLLDGGDRDHPVHYQGQYREGLETEDTVSEYIDHTGKPHVKASNQVAIYAPRFASVRAITTPSGETAIGRLASMHESKRDSGVSSRVGPQRYTDSQRLGGVRVRSRASGVNTREGQMAAENVARLNTHEQLLNTFEELSYFLRGEMLQSNEARLAAGIEAATTWTRDENPVVIATLDSLHEVTAKFRLAEIVGVEDPRKDPGRLEIVKVANRSTARPGDIVTFAIRYENKGEREVTNVRIVDNLTPRLEYIEDSATSDRDGEIIVQDNGEGSLVLTFKLDAPLKEKTGGVITFQCRVR